MQLVPGVECENSDYPKEHFKVRFPHLCPKFLDEMVYSDTLHWSYSGAQKHGQLFFMAKSKYVKYFPLKQEANAHETYESFITDVGAPVRFVTDNAQAENCSEKVKKLLRRYQTKWGTTEAHKQNKNRAERFVQELLKIATKLNHCAVAPHKWDQYHKSLSL